MMSAMSSPTFGGIWITTSAPVLCQRSWALVSGNLAGLVCIVVGEDRQMLDARQNGKPVDPTSVYQ